MKLSSGHTSISSRTGGEHGVPWHESVIWPHINKQTSGGEQGADQACAAPMQELSNLFWAFAKLRYVPRRLVAALEARLGEPGLRARMQSSSWAVLVWAAATLGMELQTGTYAALPSGDALAAFSAAEQCNLLWCATLPLLQPFILQ